MDMQKPPQLQATKHLADFVYDKDAPNGLLILYYAGHGWAETTSTGHISLSGRLVDAPNERDMSIEWTQVEHTLGKTMSDVLVIFDCCHAGLLCRPAFRGRRRSFYYVAACKEDQRTRSSGEKSFTAAMIWALKELAHGPSFTVTNLVSKLMKHKTFPRHEQEAVVYPSRFGPAHEIWIAPATKKETERTPSTHDGVPGDIHKDIQPTANILDLRFHFAEHARPEHIEETARALKELLDKRDSRLYFHRITFIDHTSYVEWPARHWLKRFRKRRVVKEGAVSQELPSVLISSEDSATNFNWRLRQLSISQTSVSMTGSATSKMALASSTSDTNSREKEPMHIKSSVASHGKLVELNREFSLVVGCVVLLSICGGGIIVLAWASSNA